jgi:calpain-15
MSNSDEDLQNGEANPF